MAGMTEVGRLRIALQAVVHRDKLALSGHVGNSLQQVDTGTITKLRDGLRYTFDLSQMLNYEQKIQELLKELFEAQAAIQRKYNEFSWFGQPTGDMALGSDARGYYRHFQQGSIFWLPAWGAHEVHGAIRDKYGSLGWESSYLGYPVTDEVQGDVRYNHFEHDTIYWTRDMGAYLLPDIGVVVERHRLGAKLHISGHGFTPGGIVRFSVEGLEGAVGAVSIGVFTSARSDGTLPDDVGWDGRTWPPLNPPQVEPATLIALDQATGRTATYAIPALY
jgi:LGFP repeat